METLIILFWALIGFLWGCLFGLVHYIFWRITRRKLYEKKRLVQIFHVVFTPVLFLLWGVLMKGVLFKILGIDFGRDMIFMSSGLGLLVYAIFFVRHALRFHRTLSD
jgi:hypothetical protein